MFNAYAALSQSAPLTPYRYDPGPLGLDEVTIDVNYCGICHSDLSMINNDWGMSTYPLVPGHEVIGTIAAMGQDVKNLKSDKLSALAGTQAIVIIVSLPKAVIKIYAQTPPQPLLGIMADLQIR